MSGCLHSQTQVTEKNPATRARRSCASHGPPSSMALHGHCLALQRASSRHSPMGTAVSPRRNLQKRTQLHAGDGTRYEHTSPAAGLHPKAHHAVELQREQSTKAGLPSRAKILSPRASTIVTRASSSDTLKKCFSVGWLAMDFISSTNFSVLKLPRL